MHRRTVGLRPKAGGPGVAGKAEWGDQEREAAEERQRLQGGRQTLVTALCLAPE